MKSLPSPRIKKTPAQQIDAAISRITWDEVISISPVFLQMAENSKAMLLQSLANHVPKTVALGLQGASIVANNGKLVVEFAEGARAMKGVKLVADLQGRKLPILMKNGKIVANARVVGGGAALLSSAAMAAAAVVIVAHMVSGADNAKHLKVANRKLDFLITARKLDQCAKMEAVFRQAKELASLPDSPETRREIHRLGLVLHEVRAAWRSEVAHRLQSIEMTGSSEKRSWLPKPIRNARDKRSGKRAAEEAGQTLAELHLMNVSLALHLALAQAAGTEEAFMSQSLPEELEAMRGISESVADLRDHTSSKMKTEHDRLLVIEEAFEQSISTFEPLVIQKQKQKLPRLKKAA